MRIGVLAPDDAWHFEDLRRAGGQHEFVSIQYSRISATLPENRVHSSNESLADLDALITRAMPAGSLEQVVFRMDALYVAQQAGLLCINSPKAVEASVDKYLSLALVSRAGITVPETIVCENHRDVGDAFDSLGGDIVMKPIFGSEGRGLVRVRERELAERYYRFVEEMGGILYLQRFVDFGEEDTRVLVVGEECFAMRRRAQFDWRSNISQGGSGEPVELAPPLREIAITASQAVGAEFAGVDIGCDRSGKPYVIEVNAAPGWRGISRVLDVDIAKVVVAYVESRR
jgi:RimK family alpha-L-glutamate ligase